MTTAGSDFPQPAPPPSPARPLLRSHDDRVLAGVAGGLGRWLDVDPVIFRVTFGVLTLFGGVGIVGYLIGYLVIPDESTGTALISSRMLPDLRRLSRQQRALIGWGAAGVCLLIAVADHRSTTVAVLIVVAAVAVLAVRAQHPRPSYGPAQPQQEYAFGPPPGKVVPPNAAFTAPAAEATWQPTWVSAPTTPSAPPQFVIRHRGRRLNRALISAAVLAVGVYLMLGSAGAYDPTTLRATAVGLTAIGVGLTATAWHARSRVALLLGVLLTVVVMLGSAIQGDYGTSVGNRTWRPTPATAIPATYRLAAGDATLDLTQLGSAAVGKTINVTMGAGKLYVIIPDGLLFSVYGHVDVGSFQVFDQRFSDGPVRHTVLSSGWTPATGVRIELRLRVGNVEVDHG
jgi:phage shock protein PspC (stress-responsive transcriptional regulator)